MGLILLIYLVGMSGTFLLVHEKNESKMDLDASCICSMLWPMFWALALVVLIALMITAMIIVFAFIFNGIWKLIKMITGISEEEKDVQN